MATAPRESNDPRYLIERRDEAAALYAELGSVRRVAAEMDVSTRRAWEYLVDAGVEMNRPGRPKGENAAEQQ